MAPPKYTKLKVVRPRVATLTGEQVVARVREMIERGDLRPGDRLPPERELAKRLGISRPSLRSGLHTLAALGVLKSKHGTGTFIAEGPPALGGESLTMLAALHGFSFDEMFEARRVMEVAMAGMAAERATAEHLAAMAEEVTEMYASLDDPQEYLIHDLRFHRIIATASGNQILATLMEMVAAALYERRRQTIERATDMKESVAMHREIYRAIRRQNAHDARSAMNQHLALARRALLHEQETKDAVSESAAKRRTTTRSATSSKIEPIRRLARKRNRGER